MRESCEKYFGTIDEMLDQSYGLASNNKVMGAIAGCLDVPENEIANIQLIKRGMTNRSFTFECGGMKYIMRIPGEGTGDIIDRKAEYDNYQAVLKYGISDEVVYFDPESGYKITRYLEGATSCDPGHVPSVKACMEKLRGFHELKLTVGHSFDPFERIEFYEALRSSPRSCFGDYQSTKANVMKLKGYIESTEKEWVMAHIDAVPDNFIFTCGGRIVLLDWEYSGMQDPHIDIAMFSVYSGYDKHRVDAVMDMYFGEGCPDNIRKKIYAYVAVCGLLWSNWCEFKRQKGARFGGYALKQYRYAKDFYRYV